MFRRALFMPLLLYPSAAAGAEPQMTPTRPWQLDYGVTQCTAARTYGASDKSIVLAIIPSIAGATYDIIVSFPGAAPPFAEEMAGSVDFGRGPLKARLLYAAAKGKGFSTLRYTLDENAMTQARDAKSVSLQARNARDFSFALTSMPQIMGGLEKCLVALREYWNIGANGYPVERDDVAARELGAGLRGIFKSSDYPAEAMYFREQGSAQYALLISETGAIAGCYLVVASGTPSLDNMGCQVIRERAKFTPAIRKGKAVRSVFVTPPITWRIG